MSLYTLSYLGNLSLNSPRTYRFTIYTSRVTSWHDQALLDPLFITRSGHTNPPDLGCWWSKCSSHSICCRISPGYSITGGKLCHPFTDRPGVRIFNTPCSLWHNQCSFVRKLWISIWSNTLHHGKNTASKSDTGGEQVLTVDADADRNLPIGKLSSRLYVITQWLHLVQENYNTPLEHTCVANYERNPIVACW